jgi:hypothetical protein
MKKTKLKEYRFDGITVKAKSEASAIKIYWEIRQEIRGCGKTYKARMKDWLKGSNL